jgi:hypothetical protein
MKLNHLHRLDQAIELLTNLFVDTKSTKYLCIAFAAFALGFGSRWLPPHLSNEIARRWSRSMYDCQIRIAPDERSLNIEGGYNLKPHKYGVCNG